MNDQGEPTAKGERPASAGGAAALEARRHDHRHVVAIDGPAAAGKTTVAETLAERIGALFLDTGLLYRAVTLLALRAGVDPADGAAVTDLLRRTDVAILPPSIADGRTADVLVDGWDVTPSLRTPEIDRHVSAVAAEATVRDELLPIQRRMAEHGRVVMVGRDITTVVVPDAGVKIYLDASLDERARRRHRELVGRGLDVPFDHVRSELVRRDAADSSRGTSPLRRSVDAMIVDTDGKSVDEVSAEIAAIAERTWGS